MVQYDVHEGARVLLIGDSIAKGVIYDEASGRYRVAPEAYAPSVAKAFRGEVINSSRFGCTLPESQARIEREVARVKPDVVVLALGGNDCDFDWDTIAKQPEGEHCPKTDWNLFRDGLAENILRLRAQDILPVLFTMPPIDSERYLEFVSRGCKAAAASILKWLGNVSRIHWWQEHYSAAISGVARDLGVALIDVRTAFMEHDCFPILICRDGIHPNAHGHRLAAQYILERIRRNCPHLVMG